MMDLENTRFIERTVRGIPVICMRDYCPLSQMYRVRFLAFQGDMCDDPSWLASPETKDSVLNGVVETRKEPFSFKEFMDLTSPAALEKAVEAFRKGMRESVSLREQVMASNRPIIKKGLG